MTEPPIQGPPSTTRTIVVDVTISVREPNGWTAHEVVSVAVDPQFLHNLGGIAAAETERAVATLIRRIGDASGKRSVRVEEPDGTDRDQPASGS